MGKLGANESYFPFNSVIRIKKQPKISNCVSTIFTPQTKLKLRSNYLSQILLHYKIVLELPYKSNKYV